MNVWRRWRVQRPMGLRIDAAFIRAKKMHKIMNYDIISMPALVIDEHVRASGQNPRKEAIKKWLQAARSWRAKSVKGLVEQPSVP